MASSLRVVRAVLGAVLILGVASGPSAVAQAPDSGSTCALTTPDEANAVFAGAGLRDDGSSPFYCSFIGTFDLVVSLQPETSLTEHKAQFPEGGADVTVAGLPGWWRESGASLGVSVNGSIVHLNGWDSADDPATRLALLTALVERIAPRVQAPADPTTVAHLRANLPAGADTSVMPGWFLVGNLAGMPDGQALTDLLASQGRTAQELVAVVATVGDGIAIGASVPGMDGATLAPALLAALAPGIMDAPATAVEIGGRQVTRYASDPPFHGAASGDLVGIATGPDPFLETFFEGFGSSATPVAPTPAATTAPPSPVASPQGSSATPSADPAATRPNVRVTDAVAILVPSVPDADGVGCSGPYMDVRFTIANIGTGTYPIADELAQTRQRIPEPEGGYRLLTLQVWIDQSGTGEDMAQQNVEVPMATVPGGALEPGQSVDVTWRYRVPDDQTSIRLFGEVSGSHFFRTTGSAGERYETEVPIPIWDLGTVSAQTSTIREEDGTPITGSFVIVQNSGGATTPGPVMLSATYAYTDGGGIGGWEARTDGPVAAGGTTTVLGYGTLLGNRPLDRDRVRLRAQVIALCPDGSPGDLSDGNKADDLRVLRQLGQTPTP